MLSISLEATRPPSPPQLLPVCIKAVLTLTAECRPLEDQLWGSGQDISGLKYYHVKVSRLNPY